MFIKVDPNNSNPPDFDVIDMNASLPILLGKTVYNDCSGGPGMMHFQASAFQQSQDVTCNNLPVNPLRTVIYEV